jgi:hypothetical protein
LALLCLPLTPVQAGVADPASLSEAPADELASPLDLLQREQAVREAEAALRGARHEQMSKTDQQAEQTTTAFDFNFVGTPEPREAADGEAADGEASEGREEKEEMAAEVEDSRSLSPDPIGAVATHDRPAEEEEASGQQAGGPYSAGDEPAGEPPESEESVAQPTLVADAGHQTRSDTVDRGYNTSPAGFAFRGGRLATVERGDRIVSGSEVAPSARLSPHLCARATARAPKEGRASVS